MYDPFNMLKRSFMMTHNGCPPRHRAKPVKLVAVAWRQEIQHRAMLNPRTAWKKCGWGKWMSNTFPSSVNAVKVPFSKAWKLQLLLQTSSSSCFCPVFVLVSSQWTCVELYEQTHHVSITGDPRVALWKYLLWQNTKISTEKMHHSFSSRPPTFLS